MLCLNFKLPVCVSLHLRLPAYAYVTPYVPSVLNQSVSDSVSQHNSFTRLLTHTYSVACLVLTHLPLVQWLNISLADETLVCLSICQSLSLCVCMYVCQCVGLCVSIYNIYSSFHFYMGPSSWP